MSKAQILALSCRSKLIIFIEFKLNEIFFSAETKAQLDDTES